MKTFLVGCAVVGLLAAAPAIRADEKLEVLKVGSEVYSNVTVTSVTTTDIYFSHAKGMGNAKLKKLEPRMQKRFHYNAATAVAVEKSQRDGNAQFRQELAAGKPAGSPKPAGKSSGSAADAGDDPVAPQLYAKSFRGQPAPKLTVERWVTTPTDYSGKFVLVDFWATWCGPCRQSIPHLNSLSAKFKDRMVVIGLSDEPVSDIEKMKSPRIDYLVGSDTQGRTARAVEVKGIPHAMLIDPRGIVRFEGMPNYLNEQSLARLLDKYSK